MSERVTHGRHCLCSACAREDWTKITGPCGMHGADCPRRYAPMTSGGLPDEAFWPDEDDRYQYADSPHNEVKARRSVNYPGRDTTEVAVMPEQSNALRVKVSYTTDCPEWWRIQIRRHFGAQGLATRAECKRWLEDHGSSMDEVLRQEFDDWQRAADEGETVDWA